MKTTCLTALLMASAVIVSTAKDHPGDKSARRAAKHENAQQTQKATSQDEDLPQEEALPPDEPMPQEEALPQDEPMPQEEVLPRDDGPQDEAVAFKHHQLRELIKRTTATVIEEKNSPTDLLRGTITHSLPADNGDGSTAYVLLRWGDLDKQIPKGSGKFYSNWDGSVKVNDGKASVIKKFAFDDKAPTADGSEQPENGKRHSGNQSGTAGSGKGRDMIIDEGDSSIVAWKSGVVGATDGLLIRLDLPTAVSSGTIQAGNFTLTFEITPQP